jgi:hypothetical protein
MSKHSAGADRAERPIRARSTRSWAKCAMRHASTRAAAIYTRARARGCHHPHAIRIKSTRLLGLAALVDRAAGHGRLAGAVKSRIRGGACVAERAAIRPRRATAGSLCARPRPHASGPRGGGGRLILPPPRRPSGAPAGPATDRAVDMGHPPARRAAHRAGPDPGPGARLTPRP